MTLPAAFLDILSCPQTGQRLSLVDDQLVSEDARCVYPLIGSIPWLIPYPRNSLLDWGAKLNHFQQVLLQEISQLEVERKTVTGATRDRVECLLLAKKDFLLEITTLLEPVTQTKVASEKIYNALRDRAPTTQNLLSYEANIYRDWQWGDEENEISKNLVLEFMPDHVGKLCVLGAGACKLALDVHTAVKPELTVATDINPFFLLAVEKLISNKSFLLTEFPLHPKLTEYVAIKHSMNAFSERPNNFFLSFADAAQPAFQKHVFNTVLTPWLIDIQPHEFSLFLHQLNQYLPIGGHWVNFGSLVFNQKRESLCYSTDEIVEIAADAGFEIEDMEQREIPYLKSPYSAGYRVENVWAWKATKRKHVNAERRLQTLPGWLLDTSSPVPFSDLHKGMKEQNFFLAELFANIDGKKSIRDISIQFASKDGSDADELESMLVSYFLRMQ